MTIDLSTETPVAFSEAKFPGNPHISTRHRWRLQGVRGVKLETFLCGGRRFTTEEAVGRFIAHLNGSTEPSAFAPSRATTAAQQKRIEAARRELRAAGIA
jgi:GTP-dependent phosphoenolpyruvate carboxykinase